MKQIDEEAFAEALGDGIAAAELGAAAEVRRERFGAKRKFAGEVRAVALRFGQLPLAFLE